MTMTCIARPVVLSLILMFSTFSLQVYFSLAEAHKSPLPMPSDKVGRFFNIHESCRIDMDSSRNTHPECSILTTCQENLIQMTIHGYPWTSSDKFADTLDILRHACNVLTRTEKCYSRKKSK